ncbi:MAG: AraC family transcriptional regulator [Eubacteriales bacterium]|nr:AraC family transcriptional regulator [Eubacteriales bacterium]
MNPKEYLNNICSDSINILVTPGTLEKGIFLYPTRLGFLATRPPFFFDHNTSESDGYIIVFTISGTGMLHYNDTDYCLGTCSVAFIPCNANYHFCAAKSDYHWRFLFMNFNGKQAQEYYEYIMNNKEPVGTIEKKETIMSLLWQLINRYKVDKHEHFAELRTFSNMIEILSEIALINAPVLYYNLSIPNYLKAVYYYLDSHYMEKITLATLEIKFAMSKYYISRQFKEYSGITINEYVIIKRLDRAKFLLKHTDTPISEIAVEVGFYDAGHFIHQFKVREHITPQAYRKVVKN